MREFVIAANWKMHKTPSETVQFFRDFVPAISGDWEGWQRSVLIFPPALLGAIVAEQLRPSASHEAWVLWGGQNCYCELQGAFTGENSPQLLKAMGAHSVLIGHSERRSLFGEGDELLARKFQVAQQVGLVPMLCVGEELAARESGQTLKILEAQLKTGLSRADFNKPFYIAYEPVWAIGTGRVASPEQAEEAHQAIRSQITQLGGATCAAHTPLLYGGSVKPDNAAVLAAQPNIDGFLVGGASLDSRSFLQIAQVDVPPKPRIETV
jgi:triosephosphate isomerase